MARKRKNYKPIDFQCIECGMKDVHIRLVPENKVLLIHCKNCDDVCIGFEISKQQMIALMQYELGEQLD